jgi:hypothetical protein
VPAFGGEERGKPATDDLIWPTFEFSAPVDGDPTLFDGDWTPYIDEAAFEGLPGGGLLVC